MMDPKRSQYKSAAETVHIVSRIRVSVGPGPLRIHEIRRAERETRFQLASKTLNTMTLVSGGNPVWPEIADASTVQ